jgi:hypothetical protein
MPVDCVKAFKRARAFSSSTLEYTVKVFADALTAKLRTSKTATTKILLFKVFPPEDFDFAAELT